MPQINKWLYSTPHRQSMKRSKANLVSCIMDTRFYIEKSMHNLPVSI